MVKWYFVHFSSSSCPSYSCLHLLTRICFVRLLLRERPQVHLSIAFCSMKTMYYPKCLPKLQFRKRWRNGLHLPSPSQVHLLKSEVRTSPNFALWPMQFVQVLQWTSKSLSFSLNFVFYFCTFFSTLLPLLLPFRHGPVTCCTRKLYHTNCANTFYTFDTFATIGYIGNFVQRLFFKFLPTSPKFSR